MSRRCAQTDRPRNLTSFTVVLLSFVIMTLWFGPGAAHAFAGDEPAAQIQPPLDTTSAPSGLSRWVTDLYHTNLYLYGALVVAVMAGMGACLGYGMDRVIRLLGIDLGRLERRE